MNDSKNYSQEMAQGAYSALTTMFGPPFPRLVADFQHHLRLERAASHPNPLVKKGHKYLPRQSGIN